MTMPGSLVTPAKSSIKRRLWLSASGLALVSALMVGVALGHLRQQALDDGQRLIGSFAQIIEEQTSRTLQSVDQQLQIAASGLAQLEASGRANEASARQLLRDQLKGSPFLRAIWVLNEQGEIQFDSDVGNIGLNLADRAYFQIYLTQPQTEFYLGAPVKSRTTGAWIINAARPIRAGTRPIRVVVAAIEPGYFDSLWRNVELGALGSVALLRQDGVLMMRSPLDDASMGQLFASSPATELLQQGRREGAYRAPSPIDGHPRVFVVRQLSSLPGFAMVVGASQALVLAQWQRLAIVVVAVWALACVAVLLLTAFLARAWQARATAADQAQQLANRLALATDAARIGVWDWDASHAEQWFASPTYFTMLGYQPSEGFGDRALWISRLHPDDRRAVVATIDTVLAGREAQHNAYEYEARILHADGGYRWVSVIGKVLMRDAAGRPSRLMGVRIDITERKRAEEAAQRHATRMRKLIDGLGTSMLVGLLTPDGRLVEVNRTALEAAGLDADEALGKPFDETYWFAYSEASRALVRDSIVRAAQGKTSRFDIQARVAAGRYITLDCSMQPLFDDNGQLEFLIPSACDITERKRAEDALRGSESRYRELFVSNPQPMWVFDIDTLEVLAVNDAAVQHYGYTEQEFLGLSVAALHPPQEQQRLRAELATTRPASGSPALWEQRGKDGSPMLVEMHRHAMRYDGRAAQLALMIDVTELKRSQAELERHRIHLEDLVAERTRDLQAANQSLEGAIRFSRTVSDAVPGIVAYWDAEVRCRYANRGYLEWFDLTAEQTLGRTPAEIFGEAYWAQVRPHMDAALAGTRQDFERVTSRPERPRVEHQIHYIPDRTDNGAVRGVFVLAFDITALKRAQAELKQSNADLSQALAGLEQAKDQLVQSEKLSALGALVAGVAHEMNTPIGNVLTTASALKAEVEAFSASLLAGTARRSEVSARAALMSDASALIVRSAARAAKLIEDFKQVAVDQASARRRPFALQPLVKEVVSAPRSGNPADRVPVDVEIAADLRLDSFPAALTQILDQLLSNAWRHAFDQPARGRIRISATVSDQMLTLVIADDGRGIGEEALKRVFEPFYTTQLGQGGSGLGLYIVHNLVTGMMGGTVEILSRPGQGTQVVMRLPLKAPASRSTSLAS